MRVEYFYIENNTIKIPAIFWGELSTKLLIAVHGDLSNKEDHIIELLAEAAISKGYQVLSFDLPDHGERKNTAYKNTPQNCISDLSAIYNYATLLNADISLFACSIGAYFSLLTYHKLAIQKSFFLSPVVSMENIIHNMMAAFGVSEQKLEAEQQIALPIGKTLDWDYYSFVKQHPVNFDWPIRTYILYGAEDNISAKSDVENFSEKNQAKLTTVENAEHYFHTKEQLSFFELWLSNSLS